MISDGSLHSYMKTKEYKKETSRYGIHPVRFSQKNDTQLVRKYHRRLIGIFIFV